jgi:hypothetical protein
MSDCTCNGSIEGRGRLCHGCEDRLLEELRTLKAQVEQLVTERKAICAMIDQILILIEYGTPWKDVIAPNNALVKMVRGLKE